MQYSVASTVAVNGDCTISTDEAGKQRGACTDALGRLVEVDEPNPGAIVSVNYHATMQSDGNFVLSNSANNALWSTGTGGTNAASIMMQDDGNLVLYIFRWSAGTYAAPSPGPFPPQTCGSKAYLMAGDRLNSGQCIVSPHGQYLLYMAPDGNFYIYDIAHGTGTWGANTYGHPGAYATLQADGNFVMGGSSCTSRLGIAGAPPANLTGLSSAIPAAMSAPEQAGEECSARGSVLFRLTGILNCYCRVTAIW